MKVRSLCLLVFGLAEASAWASASLAVAPIGGLFIDQPVGVEVTGLTEGDWAYVTLEDKINRRETLGFGRADASGSASVYGLLDEGRWSLSDGDTVQLRARRLGGDAWSDLLSVEVHAMPADYDAGWWDGYQQCLLETEPLFEVEYFFPGIWETLSAETLGINDWGVAVVGMLNPAGPTDEEGFVFESSVLTQITDPLDRPVSLADVNNFGEIVGKYQHQAQPERYRAAVWRDGVMEDLGPFTGGSSQGAAFAISDAGVIVGTEGLATVWWDSTNKTTIEPLPLDNTGTALDVNNRGQVVGYSENTTTFPDKRAFLYDDGEVIELGTLNPNAPESVAHGINDRGEVVGWSHSHRDGTTEIRRAFRYYDGVMEALPMLPDSVNYSQSGAFAINNRGHIAGYVQSDVATFAVVWTETGVHKVSEFPEYDMLADVDAWDINEKDEIVGVLWETELDENNLIIDGGTYPHFIARPVNGLP